MDALAQLMVSIRIGTSQLKALIIDAYWHGKKTLGEEREIALRQ